MRIVSTALILASLSVAGCSGLKIDKTVQIVCNQQVAGVCQYKETSVLGIEK